MIDELVQTGIFGLNPSKLKARKLPVAVRVPDCSLHSMQKNGALQPTRAQQNADPQCGFSPSHRQEHRHETTSAAYLAFLEERQEQERKPGHTTSSHPSPKKLAESCLGCCFRDPDMAFTASLPLKCNSPQLEHYPHRRTESLVGQES